MKKSILMLAVFFLQLHLQAQTDDNNLVKNPSFERLKIKSLKSIENIQAAESWDSPNIGSPKIYATVNDAIYDEYGTSWDFQAKSGKNVAGLYVYGKNRGTEKRDYIQGELIAPLEVGQKYHFSFWVHYHCSGTNNIGIVFLPDRITQKSPGVLTLKPSTFQKEVTPYDGDETWTLVEGSFTAYKPYKNFIIGNFFTNEKTRVERTPYAHYYAYIDDIIVEKTKVPNEETIPEENVEKEKEKWAFNE